MYKHLENSTTTFPIKKEIVKMTYDIEGVSVSTINRILHKYKTTGKLSSPQRSKPKYEIVENLDDFILCAIRRKVHQFYFNHELPTLDKVFKVVNDDDEDLPSFKRSTMYKILKKLNFQYTKRSRKSILLDRPDLQNWRRNYLMKMKDFRKQNKHIYYSPGSESYIETHVHNLTIGWYVAIIVLSVIIIRFLYRKWFARTKTWIAKQVQVEPSRNAQPVIVERTAIAAPPNVVFTA